MNGNIVSGKEPASRRSVFVLGIKLTLTAVAFVLLFRQIHWRDVLSVALGLPGGTIVVLVVLSLVSHLMQYLRWRLLAQKISDHTTNHDIWRGYWVGFTLGLMTPGRIGQFGRALAIRNGSLARALGASIIERSYSAMLINGGGLVAVGLLPSLGWSAAFRELNTGAATGTATALGTFILLLGLYPKVLYRPVQWLASKLPLREKLQRSVQVLSEISLQDSARLWFLTAGSTAIALLQVVVLVRAMGGDLAFLAGMLAVLLTFFLKGALPITIAALGIGEWSAVVILSGLGIAPSIAVAASLATFFLNVFLPGLAGLPYLQALRIPRFWRAAESPA